MKIIDRNYLNVTTPTCHASTATYFNGEPVFAWFGGQREGLPDSTIFIQYKGEILTVGQDIAIAFWNPILFTIKDELFLCYKIGTFCDRWQSYILNITDIDSLEYLDINQSQILPAGLNFCVKTKPMIHNDLIYCGSSVETSLDWTSFIELYTYKDSVFNPVHRTNPLVAPKNVYTKMGLRRMSNGIIQPSLWIEEDQTIHAFFRSSQGLDKLYYSNSLLVEGSDFRDFKWSAPKPIAHLENPNSGIDTVFYNDRLFLIYNPDPIKRAPLSLAELDQKDNFKVVDEIIITEKIPSGEPTHSGELSYPYLIKHEDYLHLVYTYGRRKIEHCVIKT